MYTQSLLLYIIRVSIAISLFYGLYILFLRKDTFNHTKRVYLLSIIAASLLLPLCDINFAPLSESVGIVEALLPQVEVTPNGALSGTTVATGQATTDFFGVIAYILIAGIIFLFARLVVQLLGIFKIRINNRISTYNDIKIICTSEDIAPFSFLGWIFIPENIAKQQDRATMIAHESVHAKQNHSLDVLFSELFCIFFWWNPVAWLVRREIRINLEYLADEGVIRQGFDPRNYQYLLLKITNPNASISIINNFNVSQLKNRIIMINKEKTRKIFTAKYLLVLPATLLVLLINMACSETSKSEEPIDSGSSPRIEAKNQDEPLTNTEIITDKKPYISVEQMPEFPGGSGELLKYISENLEYPETAVKNKTEGLVVVRFVVSETGDVSDASILRSVSPECDNEAIRVVESMPKWQPGKEKGEDVAVFYTLPIRYSLNK